MADLMPRPSALQAGSSLAASGCPVGLLLAGTCLIMGTQGLNGEVGATARLLQPVHSPVSRCQESVSDVWATGKALMATMLWALFRWAQHTVGARVFASVDWLGRWMRAILPRRLSLTPPVRLPKHLKRDRRAPKRAMEAVQAQDGLPDRAYQQFCLEQATRENVSGLQQRCELASPATEMLRMLRWRALRGRELLPERVHISVHSTHHASLRHVRNEPACSRVPMRCRSSSVSPQVRSVVPSGVPTRAFYAFCPAVSSGRICALL